MQDSIPFRNLYPDGLCRLDDRLFSKTIAYEDVNYRLAGPDGQRDIFERLCDFYNGYDSSIGVQMTLSSRHEDKNGNLFGMDAQGDALDDMRVEASGILQMQYERGNNGFVKRKYVTLTIEAENLPAARARFSRIEADTLNRFKVMGAGARVLDGKERLALLHGLLHPEGGRFAFEWDWLPASGLSVKDFIAPPSFEFGETRRFRIGEMYGAVSFLQILAPEIQDRILTDFMDVEGNLLVTMHIRGINQNEAIKMVKRKIPDLDAMKIQEQKKAARSGYDLDILPSDLSHLRRRGEKSPAGFAEPQRENVQYDLPHAASGAHETKAGDRRFPVGQRRPDAQLHPDPAGLPAGGRAYVLAAAGPQPYQDRTEPHHIGAGGVYLLRHPGAFHGRGRHVLRPQRSFQQHDPAGLQAVPLSQRSCVRHAGQRQVHELQTGDHLCHADHKG